MRNKVDYLSFPFDSLGNEFLDPIFYLFAHSFILVNLFYIFLCIFLLTLSDFAILDKYKFLFLNCNIFKIKYNIFSYQLLWNYIQHFLLVLTQVIIYINTQKMKFQFQIETLLISKVLFLFINKKLKMLYCLNEQFFCK